jgi:hypothetical protein
MYKATFESTFHPELGVETGPGFFSTRPVDGATFIVALVFTALILGSGLFLHQFCLTINRPYRMWGAWLLSILYTTLVAAQSGVLLRILAAGNSEDSRRSVALNLWRAALAIRNATMVLWLAFIRPLTDCVLVPDAGKTIPARLFWLFLCASFLGWYVAIDHSFEHKDPGVRGEAVWIAIGPTSFISTLWLAAFAFLSRRHYPRNDVRPHSLIISLISRKTLSPTEFFYLSSFSSLSRSGPL